MEEVGGTPRRKVSQDPDKSAGKLPAGCARLCVCVCEGFFEFSLSARSFVFNKFRAAAARDL